MKKISLTSLFLLPALLGENVGSLPYYEKEGTQALAKVNCDWQGLLADWSINFLPGRPGYLGMAYGTQHRIDIWVRPCHRPAQVARVIAHELAHRVDLLFLTREQRAEWRRIRGIPQETPWYPPPATTDFSTGAGDFAECMVWALQGATVKFKSRLGPPPTKDQQQVIRQWLAQINTAGK